MLSESQILPARFASNSTSKCLKYIEQHMSMFINYLHEEANIDMKRSRRTEYDINDYLE